MLHSSSMLCVEPQDSFFESGFFTEHQAAQAAAGHLGVRVRDIERKSCTSEAANKCVGVSKVVSRAGTVRWRARSAGGKRFSSCSAAASEEARSRGVVVKKLRKTKGRQLFVRELKTRFKAMMPLYDGVTFSDSETTPMPRLPASRADADDTHSHTPASPSDSIAAAHQAPRCGTLAVPAEVTRATLRLFLIDCRHLGAS